ncbi:MAG: flagellar motor switch protein FliN [Phycisphaerae bacterium]|nr:flagellar motor switch protein FliN [Phycisphaerae bacterium]
MAEHTNPESNQLETAAQGAQELPTSSETLDVAAEAVTPSAEEMASEAMKQVQEAAERLKFTSSQRAATGLNTPELSGPVVSSARPNELSMLSDVHLAMTVELGRTRMYVEDVLNLESGAVVELDKAAGDPVDILVNGRPVAKGEVLVLDETFCIRISEILSPVDASGSAVESNKA